jgi:hypothetical protein
MSESCIPALTAKRIVLSRGVGLPCWTFAPHAVVFIRESDGNCTETRSPHPFIKSIEIKLSTAQSLRLFSVPTVTQSVKALAQLRCFIHDKWLQTKRGLS